MFQLDNIGEAVTWESETESDVRNPSNADTHSTGNRQRHGISPRDQTSHEQEHGAGGLGPPPTTMTKQTTRVVFEVCQGEEALSEGMFTSDPKLSLCGVPDTACRKSLVRSRTLENIEKKLFDQGYKVEKSRVRSEFRFGNAGTLVADQVALLPAVIDGRKIIVKAAILPDEGSITPILATPPSPPLK